MSPRYPAGPRGPPVRMPGQVDFNVSTAAPSHEPFTILRVVVVIGVGSSNIFFLGTTANQTNEKVPIV